MAGKLAPSKARRVVRELSIEFRNTPEFRKEVSYKGGWQNATQKLEWFWYGFKKYGFLANLANCLRMREAWWESGEKRLIGMDAVGHRYWESDEISRKTSSCHRWLDYPHHFQHADWTKIPQNWSIWARMGAGRSPPQMEALHKELGPAWRDYQDATYSNIYRINPADTFNNPTIVDGCNGGAEFSNPWHPDHKKVKTMYGRSPKADIGKQNTTNIYDVDEFDPKGGALGKLEIEGLAPSQLHKVLMSGDNDRAHPNDKFTKFGDMYNNMALTHGRYNPKRGQNIWWHYRKDEAARTKRSREAVSAFEDPKFSSVNTAGGLFPYLTRYKTIDEHASEGFAKASTNERNVKQEYPSTPYHRAEYPAQRAYNREYE
eukprot:TRINITY_DN42627_c0_g1_i1.p1 TRINITY_DN42627_c0_g1~~TRINITY_DN42627_c0_g1_i1.p1  ORF type:complete len:389 (+),score=144.62 TRINITY_DN42627_c0_g1_i1:46-1167(+)